MRIGYLVLLHDQFDQAERLLRRLAARNSGFIVHIDRSAPKYQAAAFRLAVSDLDVTYAPPVAARWGTYRQALAIMQCIHSAMYEADPCERYVLLSGEDYPLASGDTITEFFASDPYAEHLETFPLDLTDKAAPGWSPYFRFRRYHVWVGSRHRQIPLIRKGLPPLPIYHGSTSWALTHRALTYIVTQFESNRRMRSYMQSSFLVDEAYVPSLMMSSPYAQQITGSNVTYARWLPTSGTHPKILREQHLPELLASGKLFARKFDAAVDESILDSLDAAAGNAAQTLIPRDLRTPEAAQAAWLISAAPPASNPPAGH